MAVYLPLFLLVSAMKLQRGMALGSVDSFSSALLYLSVETFLFASLTAVLYSAYRNIHQAILRNTALFIVYAITGVVILIEIAGHELFVQTGLMLNWSQLLFGLQRSEMLLKALEQQVGTATMLCFTFALLYLMLAPAWLFRKLKHNPSAGYQILSSGIAILLSLTYFILLVYGSAPGLPREEFRGFTGHLVLSFIESGNPDEKPLVENTDSLDAGLKINAEESVNNRLNIAIIILESTREKSVAPYVGTEVTPYFSSLAKNSLLMQHAYSTSPHTSRAIYSILCGRFPRAGKGIAETLENGIQQACLPHLLDQQGYATTFFQSATEDFENRPQLIANMGFAEFFPLEEFDTSDFEKSNYFGYEDNIMLPASQQWLTAQDKPFLATYLTVTPHFHYDTINRYGWKKYVKDKKYNAYLNTLYYQDNFLKNLVQQYKDADLYDNTLFVILGDHGEAFREHRLWGHGNIVYEEGVKVPFIIHHADKLVGIVNPRVSLLDVVPSILGQLQYDVSGGLFPGQDLDRPLEERDILLECISPKQCSSLIDAGTGLKLIHNYQRKPDELFDLASDPQELQNLAKDPQYQQAKQQFLSTLLSRISEISRPGKPQPYDSWAYHPRPVEWLGKLPGKPVAFQNQLTISTLSGDTSVLAVESSKTHVFAGDSFNLGMILADPGKNVCIDSFYQGIKRHKHRTRNVEINLDSSYPYFKFTENLQVLANATAITVDLNIRSDCSDNAPILSYTRLVIEVPNRAAGDIVFSKNGNQFFLRQTLPPNPAELVSTTYLEELLNMNTPVDQFTVNRVPGLKSEEFVTKIRNRMMELKDRYGEYQSNHLESAWKSDDDNSTFIYRYQVSFSKNQSMDFRVLVRQSEVIALYYYHPWKPDRPL